MKAFILIGFCIGMGLVALAGAVFAVLSVLVRMFGGDDA